MSERVVSHYRLLEPLGSGGMGVVYEAEDTRLGRRVAVKLLSPALAADAGAVARFLREGRTAAALSHPHVCAVFEVGEDGGQPFIVMERLEGMTLRRVIAGQPLPAGRAMELGAQIAEALEAAHAQGVVHRDLKPANVFVGRDDFVKLTDFGLARLVEPRAADADRGADTETGRPEPLTRAGAVLGTVGYMAPEQARGEAVDGRSDLFSLGAVLYEMATGRPPFAGATDAVTFAAVLGQEPLPPRQLNPSLPAALADVIGKALEKDRALRYQTAADLKVDLRRAARPVAAAAANDGRELPSGSSRPRVGRRVAVAGIGAAIAGAVLGSWATRSLRPPLPPRFTQLTFRRGIVTSARLTPDGHTVVYSALWDQAPPEIFSRRLDSPTSVSLGLPPSSLLSVSSHGELAILLAPAGEHGTVWLGTLARVPLSGGRVRPVLEGVFDADWSPDGRELAVIRWTAGAFQLEYPAGTVRMRPCPPTRVRVSPDGSRLALLDEEDGVLVLDGAGRQQRFRVAPNRQRLAWSPGGDSLLVDAGDSDLRRTLRRLTLHGDVTEICTLAGTLVVHDVGRDGRVLLHHGFERWDVRARLPSGPEREASAFANSSVVGLTDDGSQVLLWYHGDGPPGAALLQPTAGGPPLHLGEGHAHGLSADGRFVLLESGRPARFGLTPVGVGETRLLPLQPPARFAAAWRVDEHTVGFDAAQPGRPPRSFVASLPSGTVRAVTPEGVRVIPGAIEGGSVLARAADGSLAVYPLAGGEGRPLPWRLPSDPFVEMVRVSGDGRFLFVREGSVPARIDRIELQTGRRTPFTVLSPPDTTGLGHIWSVQLTPDGQGYAYTHGFFLQDLFLAEGLP